MAYSPSPQRSPVMGSSNGPSHEQNFTPTPPPVPLSKRDKRRSALSDKLNELTASFSHNRDRHYRQQLQALQVDMTLIMRADPYSQGPLDDSGEDIANLVAAATGGAAFVSGGGLSGHRRGDLDGTALAGMWYAKFVEETNDAMELRDTCLTMLENKHEGTLHELYSTNRYKIQLAQEEHRQLSRTLRERLIQSVAQKKVRLMREKEQLDIADSNALLLHPSQFSITNPASPGNGPHNRKTRHTRHRPGDADDVGAAYSGGDAANKRKRKGVGEDETDPRTVDNGMASAFRDARARLLATQVEAPIYSIDRLFTEKELAMHLNHAHVAAHNYFAELKAQGHAHGDGSGNGNEDRTNGVNGTHEPVRSNVENGTGPKDAAGRQEGEADEDALPAASDMDRAVNQSHHATRSTRNGGASSLNLLGDVATSEKNASITSSVPVTLPSSFLTKTGQAPPPPALRFEEAEDDLAKMEQLMRAPPGVTDQKLLDRLCASMTTSSHHNGLVPGLNAGGPTLNGDGAAMSAQSSMAGFSDLGGVAMSRHDEGSSMGITMRRSASGPGGTARMRMR